MHISCTLEQLKADANRKCLFRFDRPALILINTKIKDPVSKRKRRAKRVHFEPCDQVFVINEPSCSDSWWSKEELHTLKLQDRLDLDPTTLSTYLRTCINVYNRVQQKETVDPAAIDMMQPGLEAGYRGMEQWCTRVGKHRHSKALDTVRRTVRLQKYTATPEELSEQSRQLTQDNQNYAILLASADAIAAQAIL